MSGLPQGGGRRFHLIKKQQIQPKIDQAAFKGTLMVACGYIFHMPSEGDLYRCMGRMSWFGSCSLLRAAPGDTTMPSSFLRPPALHPMHWAELGGNTGTEKTSLAGKAKEGRELVPNGLQSTALQALRVGKGEAELARTPKRRVNTCRLLFQHQPLIRHTPVP